MPVSSITMKFTQLPLGSRFSFAGKTYVKTSSLIATDDTGSQRIIPRYADLAPLDADAAPPPPPDPRQVDLAIVLTALEEYHATCRRLLPLPGVDGTAQTQLEAARRRFLAQVTGETENAAD